DLVGVHDDDEVAGVDVRGVARLALAAQAIGDLGRQTPEDLALGVDDVPVARDLALLSGVGLHTEKRRTSRTPTGDGSSRIQIAGTAASPAATTARGTEPPAV